jgi:hypothetical protein
MRSPAFTAPKPTQSATTARETDLQVRKMTRVKARRRVCTHLGDLLDPECKEMDVEKIAILKVDVEVVAEGQRASLIIGSYVYNSADENIGFVDDLMINDEACVGYAIISVGGFLGLGSHLVAVPYGSLEFGEDRLCLPTATREELESLPKFDYR